MCLCVCAHECTRTGPRLARPHQLALRAGNEKEEGKTTDTVGCCSLRVEHVQLRPEADGCLHVVELDFLGKDSPLLQQSARGEAHECSRGGRGAPGLVKAVGLRPGHLPLGSGCSPSSASLNQA